jgi:DNA-binding HxlR family transcriptional regulator
MAEPAWKMVMDEDGLTISGDSFSLTTTGTDPGSLDAVVSELQGVARGTYGQYCGLSRAIEAVGERWGMLVVRDLLVSSKSAEELLGGLPGVPLNLLEMRIREMAFCGILERAGTTDATGNGQYRLTTYGRRLEDILLAFGRWGSAMLNDPRPEDIVTEDSVMVAMKSAFIPQFAVGRSERFEMRVGDIVIHLVVEDGQLETGRGPLPGAAVLDPGPTLKDMLTRAVTVEDAVAMGAIPGDPNVVERFLSMFALPYQPAPERSMV